MLDLGQPASQHRGCGGQNQRQGSHQAHQQGAPAEEELFDAQGKLKSEIAELAPAGHRRMSDNPHANGGLKLRDLKMPDFRDYAVKVPSPGASTAESAREMGKFLRDIMKQNMDAKNFRLFSPDENNSNRWQDALDVTTRCYMADIYP